MEICNLRIPSDFLYLLDQFTPFYIVFSTLLLTPLILLMGWLPLVGSLKLEVSFAECHLFYRALMQKRPILLRSLLVIATTYVSQSSSPLKELPVNSCASTSESRSLTSNSRVITAVVTARLHIHNPRFLSSFKLVSPLMCTYIV